MTKRTRKRIHRRPADAFFEAMARDHLALTFDDALLKTNHSDVTPNAVRPKGKFSRGIYLSSPFVSAPMDTVTEHRMAIALAIGGGIGIIHKNLTPEDQVKAVARVKFHLNGKIARPITVKMDDTVEKILAMCEEKHYAFRSFPVINGDGRVVGVLTGNDFDFCDDRLTKVKDVMTKTVHQESETITPLQAHEIMCLKKIKFLPLINTEGKLSGAYVFSDVKRIVNGNKQGYSVDDRGQLRVGVAIGVGESAIERAIALTKERVDVLVIDTAHGNTKNVIDTLKAIKKVRLLDGVDIVVGNISQGEAAKRLAKAGADGIKVGQGGGSICTTRVITGTGGPQLTAVYECAKAIRGSGIPICSDGGIRYSGDAVMALAAGAESVMMGNAFAGTDEAPGDIVYIKGAPHKKYRGMGSLGALRGHTGSRERYRQDESGKNPLIPEGVEGAVPHRGSVKDVLQIYLGGLCSGMGYLGAKTLAEMHRKAQFMRITPAGAKESHPHNITITTEAPNYHGQGGK